jgi:hypothetical protein
VALPPQLVKDRIFVSQFSCPMALPALLATKVQKMGAKKRWRFHAFLHTLKVEKQPHLEKIEFLESTINY